MITETTSLGNIKIKMSNCADGKFVIEADIGLDDQTEHGPYQKTSLYVSSKDDTLEHTIRNLIASTVGTIIEYHNEQMESTKEEDPCTFKPL